MKIKNNLKIRQVAGENIVMRLGDGKNADMTTVIALNESSLTLVDKLRGRDFGIDDVIGVLTAEYDVDEATARHDAEVWMQQMVDNGLIEK